MHFNARSLFLILGFAIVVGGCGGTAGPPPSPTFSLPPILLPSPSSPPTVVAQPDVNRYVARRAEFSAMWRYETVVATDLQGGEGRAFTDGALTCELIRLRGTLPGNIPPTLQKQSSWTESGAEAVVSAALRTLCPDSGARFLSTFDKEVSIAQELIRNESGIYPPEIPTGKTAKLVCDYLSKHPNVHGLWELMVSEGTPGNAPIKVVVRKVTAAHCIIYNDWLGFFWYDDWPGPPRF